MASLKLVIAYELDDGQTGTVVADQRDFAKWELQPQYAPIDVRPFTSYRWLSWSAAKREGVTTKPFEWWDAHLVEARDPEDAEDVEVGEGTPTSPDQPGGT